MGMTGMIGTSGLMRMIRVATCCMAGLLCLGAPETAKAARWKLHLVIDVDVSIEQVPDVVPEPVPQPDPEPTPEPSPEPTPEPVPDPGPLPSPVDPVPQPDPVPADPAPEPDPPPDQQATTGQPHAYFEAVSSRADAIASWSLRDPTGAQYQALAVKRVPNPNIAYDPEYDAAKVTFPLSTADAPAGYSLPAGSVLTFRPPASIGPVSKKTGKKYFTFTFEIRFDRSMLGLTHDSGAVGARLNNYKALRLSGYRADLATDAHIADSLMYELQTRFSDAAPGTIALPSIRSYMSPTFYDQPSVSSDNLNSVGPDGKSSLQPGRMPVDYYYWPSEKWVRGLMEVSWVDGVERFRVLLSDEDHDPLVIVASPGNPDLGYKCDSSTYYNVIRGLQLLCNTSTSGANAARTYWLHTRNYTYSLGDERIPFKGRPGK